jgi:hypothetical protein
VGKDDAGPAAIGCGRLEAVIHGAVVLNVILGVAIEKPVALNTRKKKRKGRGREGRK